MFDAIDKAYRQATIAAGVSSVPRILLRQTFEDIVGSSKLESDDENSSGKNDSIYLVIVELRVTSASPSFDIRVCSYAEKAHPVAVGTQPAPATFAAADESESSESEQEEEVKYITPARDFRF